jgi:hypothetical protein
MLSLRQHEPKSMKTHRMTLKSAMDDLVGTTLAAVSGVLGKLVYVSRLRDAGGERYSHWGLSRVHGEVAAQKALAEAHRLLLLRVLRTPLRELRNDFLISSEASQMDPEEFLGNLRSHLPVLVPANLSGGSVRQLNSMLQALSSLGSSRTQSVRDATPLT